MKGFGRRRPSSEAERRVRERELPRKPNPVSVRKTGAAGYEWEARCSEHDEEKTYIHFFFGAVAFNTRGVGNRIWFFAQYAADQHIKEFHS